MLQNMKKEVKVGLFAILMLLIGWGVIRVLKGADLFGNTNTYYAYYEQVGGLQEASQVMLYGQGDTERGSNQGRGAYNGD